MPTRRFMPRRDVEAALQRALAGRPQPANMLSKSAPTKRVGIPEGISAALDVEGRYAVRNEMALIPILEAILGSDPAAKIKVRIIDRVHDECAEKNWTITVKLGESDVDIGVKRPLKESHIIFGFIRSEHGKILTTPRGIHFGLPDVPGTPTGEHTVADFAARLKEIATASRPAPHAERPLEGPGLGSRG
jgi:hypothetical protein